ncbi:hypothetical protein [Streptomyces rubiginosohelvolus]|uniref:hypothetical protein n=1 Tax=Streptomyces rubiginosohelvolus TaxID=67362 RepID=UPI0038678E78|nr:hypothetical protein OG475_34595 [Streptomyces rubiginosohelvolus]
MSDQIEKTDIQSRYRKQYADDLAANRQKQGDLTAQIAGLQKDLEQLKSEEAWLTQAQGTLPGTAGPGETAPGPAAAAGEPAAEAPQTVPAQRHDDEAEPTTRRGKASKSTPAKKTPAKKTAAKKTAAKKRTAKAGQKATAKTAAAKPQAVHPAEPGPAESSAGKTVSQQKEGPVMWQLALDILHRSPGHPCAAREVAEQLALEHPGRSMSVQVVRNSLETLVKKGLAEKTQQQRSVMYTATPAAPTTSAGDAAGGSEPEPEQAGGTEAESEKAAAGV